VSITQTTLVIGTQVDAREAAIAKIVDLRKRTAIIVEGLPAGTDVFDRFIDHPNVELVRIAPGCLCCTGNLTMRVSLHRILRHHPDQLYISLATASHLAEIQRFLSDPPYSNLLALTEAINCDC
jgi:G3E family GTPase